jgi:hypothetical protein
MLFQVEERLLSELTKAKLRWPINEKRAIAFFEARLTEIIRTAIRRSPLSHTRSGREWGACAFFGGMAVTWSIC